MKTFLVLAAALGFSISAASADCAWHSKESASVDTQAKTASVDNAGSTAVANAQTSTKKAGQAE